MQLLNKSIRRTWRPHEKLGVGQVACNRSGNRHFGKVFYPQPLPKAIHLQKEYFAMFIFNQVDSAKGEAERFDQRLELTV